MYLSYFEVIGIIVFELMVKGKSQGFCQGMNKVESLSVKAGIKFKIPVTMRLLSFNIYIQVESDLLEVTSGVK